MPGDTPVWRYLTLSAVIATIKTRHLRLTRVYADVNYEDPVRHAINAKDPNLADRVVLSVLHERRYPPGF